MTNGRPAMNPRSMRSSTPSPSASRHREGSSRSRPRSRAKWLRVPAEMTSSGMSCSAAIPATSACVPSPPATPSRSAPSAMAWRASSPTSMICGPSSRATVAPEGLGLVLEAEPGHLPTTRARVHDQIRPLGRRGVMLAHPLGGWVAAQRRPAGRHRHPQQPDRHQHDPQQPSARVEDQHDQRAPGPPPRPPASGQGPCGSAPTTPQPRSGPGRPARPAPGSRSR